MGTASPLGRSIQRHGRQVKELLFFCGVCVTSTLILQDISKDCFLRLLYFDFDRLNMLPESKLAVQLYTYLFWVRIITKPGIVKHDLLSAIVFFGIEVDSCGYGFRQTKLQFPFPQITRYFQHIRR